MKNFSTSPLEMFTSFWRNRLLIKSLVERDVVGRYRGSYLGMLWSLLNPIFSLVVYTFVFSVIFKARWGIGSDSKVEFALVLFVGLIVFNFFSECVTKAPSLIVGNANYVKKIVFPLEILPMVLLGSALFHFLIGLGVWFIFYVLFFGLPNLSVIFFPVMLIPLFFLTLGISFAIASLGVYLRDITQIIGVLLMALMFLSPIFYPLSAIPEEYQKYLTLNLIAPSIEYMRATLIWGKFPSLEGYLFYLATSLMVAILGFAWFQKTRKGFADVL